MSLLTRDRFPPEQVQSDLRFDPYIRVVVVIDEASACQWLDAFLPAWRAARSTGYRSLAAALREAISDERLVVGTRLPPQRELARLLGVGRTTVVSAYNVLEGEGLIRVSHGAGTWVVAPPSDPAT